MTPLVIIGAGGFGREVLDVVEAINSIHLEHQFLGFVDDGEPPLDLLKRRGATWLGPVEALRDIDAHYLIGIGDSVKRAKVDAMVSSWGPESAAVVHPSATTGADVRIGPGSVITAGVRVTTNVEIGRHVHLNLNSTVGHDVVMEDYVTTAPGVFVSGAVRLGRACYLGTGASINQGLVVGENTVVGAGAAVVRDLPANVTAVGIPARPLER